MRLQIARRAHPAALFLLTLAACAGPSSSSTDQAANSDGEESALETSGDAVLVVPLIDENKKLLSRFNAQARAKGLREMPDTVEVKNQADGHKVADLRSYYDDKIMAEVHGAQSMPSWGPDSFTNWSKRSTVPGLCYRGPATKVPALMSSLADTVFSDQLMIHGWRYKTTKHFGDGDEEYESDFPDVWKEWRGAGTALLVVTSIGDGGDDLTPAVIPHCK